MDEDSAATSMVALSEGLANGALEGSIVAAVIVTLDPEGNPRVSWTQGAPLALALGMLQSALIVLAAQLRPTPVP